MKNNDQVPSLKPVAISAVILLCLVAGYFIFPGFKAGIDKAWEVLTSDDRDRIQEWVEQFGIGGPAILILVMVAQMFLFIVPNILVMMIAIISYGPVWGSLISLLGVFASSSVGYIIGCTLGPRTVNKLVSPKTFETIRDFVRSYGISAIFITRMASLCNDSLGFAAGLLRMNYQRFILATLGGITPLVILLAVYGLNGKIEKALIWIGGFSLVILVIYIFFDKRIKHKKKLQALSLAKK